MSATNFKGYPTVSAAKRRSLDVLKLTDGTYAAVKGGDMYGLKSKTNIGSAMDAGLITSMELLFV